MQTVLVSDEGMKDGWIAIYIYLFINS